ncbi:DUF5926 family protein [Tenggerimyces flavus]|uniref:DUF5926 family protein n=1 Tax=Tenggerimyces flavus TaxID=1708749 RepID=A0ABV7YFZ1_9ACTN|nr:DUF5926 family protein [Tenggerimyces flavus]MBM7784516.1 hypothetical protein [Tenggerimyces flavus]
MAKKARAPRRRPELTSDQVPVVGLREPCPCGSGKRYKQCHGRASREVRDLPPARSFEGLAGECDWVALRTFVPAATAPLRLAGSDQSVLVATVLPLAWPSLVAPDGTVYLGAQVPTPGSGDASRDLGAALAAGLAAKAGTVPEVPIDSSSPRLQDLLDVSVAPSVEVHPDVSYWSSGLVPEGDDDLVAAVASSVERVNAAIDPTVRLSSVDAAYWVHAGDKWNLRWVLPHEEDAVMDAFARLHAAGGSALIEGSRMVGSFRAHGLTVPVWELPPSTPAAALEEPAATFAARLGDALAVTGPLTSDERRARAGLAGRQVTLR